MENFDVQAFIRLLLVIAVVISGIISAVAEWKRNK